MAIYFSNLGVAQMQRGILDEAYANLKKAEALDPNADGLQGNLKAIQQHLDWRENNKKLPEDQLWDPNADDDEL